MANAPPSNLLDEALDDKGAAVFLGSSHEGYAGGFGGRIVLVEDCVETSGSFVVHHLMKRSLSLHSSDIVFFVSFAHPFPQYDCILRKMGCNLSALRDSKRLLFFDVVMAKLLVDRRKTSEDKVISLYGRVQKAVELCLSDEDGRHVTFIIDDISLIEVDANGSSNLVLDFIHYCNSLTEQFDCSLIVLNHADVYSIRMYLRCYYSWNICQT
ncbi:hypothetical protein OROGR_009171 [Orobanche gracilis]